MTTMLRTSGALRFLLTLLLLALGPAVFLLMGLRSDDPAPPVLPADYAVTPRFDQPSDGCLTCHGGAESMHRDGDAEIGITCVGCHGGDGEATTQERAHVRPRLDIFAATSANPFYSFAALNHERPEFIRFMNPGDLRVAGETCGQCHEDIYNRVLTSIMASGAVVPQAAFYNNGVLAAKRPVYGEGYMPDGTPAVTRPMFDDPTQGLLNYAERSPASLAPKIEPLARFQIIPATDPFRVLERGNNDAGTRARGTDFKVAGAGIAVHKTRLNDPTLWFMGTSQDQGDFRHGGCTGCHVVYANDRDTLNAGPQISAFYRAGGRPGLAGTADPAIPKNERGHPIAHRMTVRVPVSQCLTCHHHQGNGAIGSYAGTMWWDQESDADQLLSASVHRDEQMTEAARDALYPNNDRFDEVQFADFHGHSWNYRKVYKRDKQGRLLSAGGAVVSEDDPDKFDKALHLRDIHFEKGMHCIDCHTEQDVHGDGRLWGAMADPIEIACVDCHGQGGQIATLTTSGLTGGRDLASRLSGARTFTGARQFEVDGPRIVQNSKMYEALRWEVTQLAQVNDPNHAEFNEKASKAHTMRRDGNWGDPTADPRLLAHSTDAVECYTCHSAWNTGCYGCHLPLEVNDRMDAKHYEGQESRGQVYYNPQVLRSDNFLIGINANSEGNKFAPIRSASAVTATVTARNRQTLVHQQPTISAAGYSGYAFSPNVPHTVRAQETKACTDCHLAADNTNNAWMGSLLGQGTNFLNYMGEYTYVATGRRGVQAVQVSEGFEPQPIIGSYLHRILHPESYRAHEAGGRRLTTAHGIDTRDARGVAARGEYVLVADGRAGLRVIDRANIGNKNEAQRLVLSQNSPLAERLAVNTRYATAVALPSMVPLDGTREQLPENLERPVEDLFRYAFVADREEGLIVVDVHTLIDANPENNFLRRTTTYNPNGQLTGAVDLRVAGNYAYLVSETSGLHVIDVSNPRAPQLRATVAAPTVNGGRAVAIQFRYAFVADADGVKVIDVTQPEQPQPTPGLVRLGDARGVWPVRTYLYAAAGTEGLAIIDIQNPERPQLVETFSAGGQINDANAVTTGAVNASVFAFVADGRNGLRVIRLVGPPDTPGHLGFSPRPVPQLVATYPTKGPALAVGEGTSRDRVVDESGNQIGVMGRLGSQPLRPEYRDRLLRSSATGQLYFVTDDGAVVLGDPRPASSGSQ